VTEPDNVKSPLFARQQESLMEMRQSFGNSHLSNKARVLSPQGVVRKSVGVAGVKREVYNGSQEHS
jgi:hypothetical protein